MNQTDIALIWNVTTQHADFQIINQGLATDLDLQTAVTVSLFSDRLALATDELPTLNDDDRRGWWADQYFLNNATTGQIIGSRLWLLSRSKSFPNVLQVAQSYCYEALNWLLTQNIASTVNVETAFYQGNNQIMLIKIGIFGPTFSPTNLSYTYSWNQIQATF